MTPRRPARQQQVRQVAAGDKHDESDNRREQPQRLRELGVQSSQSVRRRQQLEPVFGDTPKPDAELAELIPEEAQLTFGLLQRNVPAKPRHRLKPDRSAGQARRRAEPADEANR